MLLYVFSRFQDVIIFLFQKKSLVIAILFY